MINLYWINKFIHKYSLTINYVSVIYQDLLCFLESMIIVMVSPNCQLESCC